MREVDTCKEIGQNCEKKAAAEKGKGTELRQLTLSHKKCSADTTFEHADHFLLFTLNDLSDININFLVQRHLF